MLLAVVLIVGAAIALVYSSLTALGRGIVPREKILRTLSLAAACDVVILAFLLSHDGILIQLAVLLGAATIWSAEMQRRHYASVAVPAAYRELQRRIARRRAGLEPLPKRTGLDEIGRRIVAFFIGVPYEPPPSS